MDLTVEKVRKTFEEIEKYIKSDEIYLDNLEYSITDYKNSDYPEENAQWKSVKGCETLSGENHFWIKGELTIPEKWNNDRIKLYNNCSVFGEDNTLPQTLVYLDGKMIGAFDNYHNSIILDNNPGKHDLLLYIYLSDNQFYRSISYSIAAIDTTLNNLYYDLYIPYKILDYTTNDTKDFALIRQHLSEACNRIKLTNKESVLETAKNAIDYLSDNFYNNICGKNIISASCIGHSHIDIAWLWPVKQTKEKAQRTFSTVINLLKNYPEYKFMSSQPILYEFIKDEAPELFKEIKAQIEKGRWEIEGAMWLESDCNLTSGESLIRQILYGKSFIKIEFNKDSKILWLPDTFGFLPALPQIMKKSGIDYFVTSKISCNDVNRFPYDIFKWKGIDGTEVFAYFLTGQEYHKDQTIPSVYTTYGTTSEPSTLRGTWERFQQKGLSDKVLLPFGYGDGGGGPTEEMLEYLRREKFGIPGCPKAEISFVSGFLDEIFDKIKSSKELPTWVGELYLEFHRGTYTSQAANKKNNRKSEFLLENAETLSITDMILTGKEYPKDLLHSLWKKVLLNQFHDILPGSSIHEVYEDSKKDYDYILKSGTEIVNTSLKSIADNISTDGGILVYNPNSFTASASVRYDDKYIYAENIPSKGWKIIDPVTENKVEIADDLLSAENDIYIIEFDRYMNITHLYDKRAEREVIPSGSKANEIQAFEDFPRGFDAWNITYYYEDKMTQVINILSKEIVDEGERKGIRYVKTFDKSIITQTVWLYSHSPRIDFETEIDWHNENTLLKAAFPVDINSDKATFDIQFGNIERPTHRNTSWEEAKYEVCGHKFVDLSEYDYGVSLLNDCKYGHDVHGNTIRLTLLKSAVYPDPDADKGMHKFTYSLLPHTGDYKSAGTYKEAYLLNQPMKSVKIDKHNGNIPECYSLVKTDSENIFIETIKQSEDEKTIIFRLYDAYNMRTKVNLEFGFDFSNAYICDLLENRISDIPVDNKKITLEVKPFEIVSVMIEK